MVKNSVEELSEKQFDEKIEGGVSVVDFFAEWCMPCLMMAPIIEDLADKMKGKINFFKINIDENQELAERFGVMSIPTLIFFKNGEEVDRTVGALQAEQIEEKINEIK